jgi:hypothetical protein
MASFMVEAGDNGFLRHRPKAWCYSHIFCIRMGSLSKRGNILVSYEFLQ